jgi:hypothetical protein
LIEHGTDINAEGGEYGNAMQAAVQRRDVDIIDLLTNATGDANRTRI